MNQKKLDQAIEGIMEMRHRKPTRKGLERKFMKIADKGKPSIEEVK